MEIKRYTPDNRPAAERVKDYQEIEKPVSEEAKRGQAARCMDCGVPFCNTGCPLGNLIPDWNDLAYNGRWEEALDFLHKTNNFPEWTGRVCPAPCESACVLGINDDPVSIKLIEKSIIEKGWEKGLIKAKPPARRTGKKIAVVGSGPAGLAAADQLNKAGHSVTVLEKWDRIGGLLRYGIPDFKLEKKFIDRRLEVMQAEGVVFKTGVHVGKDVTGEQLRKEYDVVVLATGAEKPRELPVPGRELPGVHRAMEFLPLQNKRVAGDKIPAAKFISAAGKHVIVIGGGDTGADCVGTSHRQGAKSVTQFELMPKPPEQRDGSTPWPQWPLMLRTSTSHEEGGKRDWCVSTKMLTGNGKVEKLLAVRVEWVTENGRMTMKEVAGTEFELPADLVLLAMGFTGPVTEDVVAQLGCSLDPRGCVAADGAYMTSVPGVFAAGDAKRGASLVVWAIWEGREAARCVDQYLMGPAALLAV
jgi:glutamate synthase (NADPH/NADH) small chain